MDQSLIDRIKEDMRYEFARTAPPEGFPKFHDISVERHTSKEFFETEEEHVFGKSWVIAGRAEDVAGPGDCLRSMTLVTRY